MYVHVYILTYIFTTGWKLKLLTLSLSIAQLYIILNQVPSHRSASWAQLTQILAQIWKNGFVQCVYVYSIKRILPYAVHNV